MDYRFGARMDNMTGTATREIFKLVADPTVISFAGGMPGKECLPYGEIAVITERLLGGPRASSLLQYGTTDGLPSAREAMTQYVKAFGIKDAEVPNILMLSGGQQGLDLVCRVMLDKGDAVLVEDPTYLAMLQIINSYEAKSIGVESGGDGLNISDLEAKIKKHKPKILYVVPTFSNPTGRTYSLENRKKIAEITAKHNVVVIEDDPYSRLRFEGEEVPSLKSLGGGNIVFVTSFSKIISPGLRVAAAVGSAEIIRKLEICKQGVDVHTPNLNQAIVEEFITGNLIPPHLKKIRPVYKAKHNKMRECIARFMPKEFVTSATEGGLFIWGEFCAAAGFNVIDTYALFRKAIERKVAYVYGNVFYADGSGRNTLRLNFSNSDLERIERGIKILGDIFKESI